MEEEITAKGRYTPAGAALHGLSREIARAERRLGGSAFRGRAAVLGSLASGPPATLSEIARRRGTSRQALQRIARELVRDGLAERLPNPRHRRAPLLRLTPRGRERARAEAAAEAERLNALAREIDPRAIRAAERILRALGKRAQPSR